MRQSAGVVLALLLIYVLPINVCAYDTVSLPWETTYDCEEWTQSDGDGNEITCYDDDNGLVGARNDVYCGSPTKYEQVTASANMATGGGGLGQRHWQCDGEDSCTTGMRVYFTTPQTELWIRWYMRYQDNFEWGPDSGCAPSACVDSGGDCLVYDKWLYIDASQADAVIPEFESHNGLNIYANGANHKNGWTYGWDDVMAAGEDSVYTGNPTRQSDGEWHLYEIHIGSGNAEIWIDEVLRLDEAVTWGSPSWTNVIIGHNQECVNNNSDMYVDIDDIAISNSGYIGPLDVTDTTPPELTSQVLGTDGQTLTLGFDEAVEFGAGGNSGWTIIPSGGAATVSYSSGAESTSLVYTTSRAIRSSETITISYTQPENGVEDAAGNDLEDISSESVTNNSTVPPTNPTTSGCIIVGGSTP